MSDIRSKAKDIIIESILRSTLNDQNKTVGEIAEKTLNQLLEMGMLLPPCNIGDTVYWLDACLHIVPVEVGGFKVEVVGKNGNTYVGGVYSTEEEAKAQREKLRAKECKQCLTQGINGNYLVGCEKGFDCSKKPFVERNGGHWLSQIEAKVPCKYEINHSYEYNRCKRCYMKQKRDGVDCTSEHCVYAGNRQLHSNKWDEEFEKSKENYYE